MAAFPIQFPRLQPHTASSDKPGVSFPWTFCATQPISITVCSFLSCSVSRPQMQTQAGGLGQGSPLNAPECLSPFGGKSRRPIKACCLGFQPCRKSLCDVRSRKSKHQVSIYSTDQQHCATVCGSQTKAAHRLPSCGQHIVFLFW